MNTLNVKQLLLIVGPAVFLVFGSSGFSQTFQELHAFRCIWDDNTGWDCSHSGVGPQCSLVQARDGNFYGTTTGGGPWDSGSVFRITPEGVLTTLAYFDGTNGYWPYGALVEASDGNFYGSTLHGWGRGTFFRITPSGALTNFGTMQPIHPLGDFVQGLDGKLYGASDGGSIFRFTTNGAFELLHLFSGGDGSYPSGGLLLASDGHFYGVTAGGGAGYGTVYRISTNGEFASLARFPDYPDGAVYPGGRLVEAPDGSLYGTALSAGSVGAVFRVTKGGSLRTVADFRLNYGGEYPVGPLVLGRDGNFYGCCRRGGTGYIAPQPCGTIFRMSPEGAITLLFSFTGYGGQYSGVRPSAGLIQAKDGNLYGTTAEGGTIGGGNIFRLIMPGNECSVTCATNITVCNDPGQCGAVVHFAPPKATNCNGAVVTSTPPSGSFFPIGTNTVFVTAVDPASGHLTNTCTFMVTVHDCEPPVIHRIAASPDALWPPNQRMQPITLAISATDNCPLARSKIISVSSNGTPPDNSSRTASTDWEITGDLTVNLRAARSGSGGNRVYSIAVECRDESGNSATSLVRVAVER